MPRILLVNCPSQVWDALKGNRDYDVTEVVRSQRLSADLPDDIPDPRSFDIVIDDSANAEPDGQPNVAVRGTVVVPGQYTDALRDANALLYVPFGRHQMTEHGSRFSYIERKWKPGYIRPEWRPASPEADYFRNFLVEFESELEPAVFEHPAKVARSGRPPLQDCLHIYEDEYGDPRIFSYFAPEEKCRVLVTPNIPEPPDKARACKFLLDHVFPFFAAHAYTDVLVPSTVKGLREQWAAEHARFRERMTELDRLQRQEEEFFGPYKPVIRLLGNPLHLLVAEIFKSVWGMAVTNLDVVAEARGERRRADLLLEWQDWRALVEVTGGGRRAASYNTDLEPFLKHIEKHEAQLGSVAAKILMFNPHTARPLSERLSLPPWADDFEEDAVHANVTVMTTFDLFRTLELKREQGLDTRRLVEQLSKPGRLELQ